MTASAFTISRLDPADVDRVEPLWNALREHHEITLPEHGPARTREASWAMRRERYTEWLAEPSAFALIATAVDVDDQPAAGSEIGGGHRAVGSEIGGGHRAVGSEIGAELGAAGKLLGYAVVTDLGAETTFAHDRVGCLETIAVDPSARRLGVGSALLEAARRGAAAEGLPDLTITVFSGNASALAFYARHGFTEYLKVLRAPNPDA